MIAPRSLAQWLLVNFKIGALSLGGAGRALLFHHELVEQRHWLEEEEFHEFLTLAQVLPGPNLINLTLFIGNRLFHAWGAVLGFFFLALPGALLAALLWRILPLEQRWLQVLFQGFSLGSVVLIAALIYKLIQGHFTLLRASKSAVPPAPASRSRARAFFRIHPKIALRFTIASLVATASLLGYSLTPVIAVAIACSLLLEFGYHD